MTVLRHRSNEPACFWRVTRKILFAMVLTMISAVENILILIARLRYAHFCIKKLLATFIQIRSKSIYDTTIKS